MSERWQQLVNAVVYLMDDRPLSDAAAAEVAERLVTEPLWDLTREQELRYLTDASDSERHNVAVPTVYSETEIRDFATRLVARMKDLQPWPPLSFQQLPVQRWDEASSAAHTRAIRLIDRGPLWIQNILGRGFVRSAVTNQLVLPLLLPSGATVAFIGQYWPGRNATALFLMNSGYDAEQVVRELLSASDLTPERIIPIEL